MRIWKSLLSQTKLIDKVLPLGKAALSKLLERTAFFQIHHYNTYEETRNCGQILKMNIYTYTYK